MSRRAVILGAAVALGGLVIVIVLARGEEPSARLHALEADPMATYVPPGGRLIDTDSQNEGSALGKPVSARYSRMFELAPGTAARALIHARAAATAAGWKPLLPSSRTFANVVAADKRVQSGRVELNVTVFPDSLVLPDGVTPPALLVSLRHLGP